MASLPGVDLQAIEEVHNRWLDLERAGDGLAVLQLCTDDVVWIPPNSHVLVGQPAITQWLKSEEVEIISLETTDLRIVGSGTVAYKTSNYSTAYVAADRAEITKAKGTNLWILHKLPDSGWKVAIVTWSVLDVN
ncbi:MAG TPA: DUF4440 domain-containing protein [Pyrinomonadaceae bacterium]|nr:DUF4440 domain-containing protein [Pyrinomonadaceae bacterium]